MSRKAEQVIPFWSKIIKSVFDTCTIWLLLRQCWFHVGVKSDRVSHVVSDSILHQLFIVRFLGSMEVKATESADVIYETMRQILAARAIHNIFRMTESHLLVTCECLKWVTAALNWSCLYTSTSVSWFEQTPNQNIELKTTHIVAVSFAWINVT